MGSGRGVCVEGGVKVLEERIVDNGYKGVVIVGSWLRILR